MSFDHLFDSKEQKEKIACGELEERIKILEGSLAEKQMIIDSLKQSDVHTFDPDSSTIKDINEVEEWVHGYLQQLFRAEGKFDTDAAMNLINFLDRYRNIKCNLELMRFLKYPLSPKI